MTYTHSYTHRCLTATPFYNTASPRKAPWPTHGWSCYSEKPTDATQLPSPETHAEAQHRANLSNSAGAGKGGTAAPRRSEQTKRTYKTTTTKEQQHN